MISSHRRARGAALREAGADARPAVLLRLRGHAGRRLVPRDPRAGARAAPLPARSRDDRAASCTRRCGAASRAPPCSSTARRRTRCGSPARSRKRPGRRSPSGGPSTRVKAPLLGHRRDAADDRRGRGCSRSRTALEEVSGVRVDLHGMATAGMTDYAIAEAALARRRPRERRGDGDALARPPREQARRSTCTAGRAASARRARGARGPLEGRDDVVNLLLTGQHRGRRRARSSPTTASTATSGAGGAFCIGPGERTEIARRALPLANGADPRYVIGDTPADVECGKAIDARTIAVATGSYAVEELAGERAVAPARAAARAGALPRAARARLASLEDPVPDAREGNAVALVDLLDEEQPGAPREPRRRLP